MNLKPPQIFVAVFFMDDIWCPYWKVII